MSQMPSKSIPRFFVSFTLFTTLWEKYDSSCCRHGILPLQSLSTNVTFIWTRYSAIAPLSSSMTS